MLKNYRIRKGDDFEELFLEVQKIGFNKEKEHIFFIELQKRMGTVVHYDDRDIQTTENKSSAFLEVLDGSFNVEPSKKNPEGFILKSKVLNDANLEQLFYCLENLLFTNIQKFNMSQNYCSTVLEYEEQMNCSSCFSWSLPFEINEDRYKGQLDDFYTYRTEIPACRNITKDYREMTVISYKGDKTETRINPERDQLGWEIFQEIEPDAASTLKKTGNGWGCHFFNGCEYLGWLENNDSIEYYEDISWDFFNK